MGSLKGLRMKQKFRIENSAPHLPETWATTEFLYWDEEIVQILKNDPNGDLLNEAYDSIDWEMYYGRLKGSPFYEWKKYGTGFLNLAGPGHLDENTFFSVLQEISVIEEDFLKENPHFNQILHDLHIEVAEKIIEYLLK